MDNNRKMDRIPCVTLPTISIVIPTYNRSRCLRKALDSFVRQMYLSEIILVDDGSTDDTPHVFECFSRENSSYGLTFKYIRNEKKKGPSAARNIGVDAASSPYIVFGEDDVIFAPDYCQVLLESMIQNPCGAVAGRFVYLKEGETPDQAFNRIEAEFPDRDKPHGRDLFTKVEYGLPIDEEIVVPILPAFILVRRDLVRQIRFDENTYIRGRGMREENDFQIRLQMAGYNLRLVPQTYLCHLPRPTHDPGGQWSGGLIGAAFWEIVNTGIFWKRYHSFLKEHFDIEPNWPLMLARQSLLRIRRLLSEILALYTPNLHRLVKRLTDLYESLQTRNRSH